MTAVADPYAPVNFKERPARRAPDHPPIARLRRLGLSRDIADELQSRWRELTDEEKFETLAAIDHLTDDELREGLAEMEDEIREALAERQAQAEVVDAAVEQVTGEAADADAVDVEDVPDDTVAEILIWVGDDRARASAALLAEQRRHDPPRKGVVGPLMGLLD